MYLAHCTLEENLKSMKRSGFIYSQNEMVINSIRPHGGFTTFNKRFTPFDDQYQGVYMSIIDNSFFTKKNIGKYSKMYIGKYSKMYMIIFNINLLFEDNKYHFNVYDSNGRIDKSTYFPEDLETILSLDLDNMNEVVFHHKIDIRLAETIIRLDVDDIHCGFQFDEKPKSNKHLQRCKNLVRETPLDSYGFGSIKYIDFKELYMNEWNQTVLKECTCEGCL